MYIHETSLHNIFNQCQICIIVHNITLTFLFAIDCCGILLCKEKQKRETKEINNVVDKQCKDGRVFAKL